MPNHSSLSIVAKRAARLWYFLRRICPKSKSLPFHIRQYITILLPSILIESNRFSIISAKITQFPICTFVQLKKKLNVFKIYFCQKLANLNYLICSYGCHYQHRLIDNSFLMFHLLYNNLNFTQ